MARTSKPERDLLFQIKAAGLPDPETEVRFHPVRKWRLDLAWPDLEQPLGVEIQGGGWGRGKHRGKHHRPQGYRNDCEKMAHALMEGWRILFVVPEQIRSGEALAWIEELLSPPPSS